MGTSWQVIKGQLYADRYLIAALWAVGWCLELWLIGDGIRLGRAVMCTFFMVPLAVLDLRYLRLYHRLTLPMLLTGMAFMGVNIWLGETALGMAAVWHWLGGCIWGILLLLIFVVSRGAMGFGDVCFGAALGCYMEAWHAVVAFCLTFLLGLPVAIGEYLRAFLTRSERKKALPLGPFMAMAAQLTLLWGQELILWYMKMW